MIIKRNKDEKLRYFLILTCMILCVDNVVAEIVLPQIYTDNMVLQRNSTITMSGHANPKSRVTLSADWLQESISTQANIDGYFSLRFSTPVAGGPYSMVINDGVDKKYCKIFSLVRSGYAQGSRTWNSRYVETGPDLWMPIRLSLQCIIRLCV